MLPAAHTNIVVKELPLTHIVFDFASKEPNQNVLLRLFKFSHQSVVYYLQSSVNKQD